MIGIDERFSAACSPVISSNYNTCGSVTRANIDCLTPTDLDNLFRPSGVFADLDAWFFHSIEMKACGVQRNTFYDWIMANTERKQYKAAVTGKKVVGSPSLLHPFVLGTQRSVVNAGFWRVIHGFNIPANTTATPTNGTTGTSPLANDGTALGTDWNYYDMVNVDSTGSAITYNQTVDGDANAAKCRLLRVDTRHGIPMDANFFRHGDTLHVFTRSAAGSTEHTVWRVLNAVAITCADAATYIDISVVGLNSGSTDRRQDSPTSTTGGVIIPGINNVNDYEKHCQNRPTIDPRKVVPFFLQTFRNSRCYSSEYRKVYARLMQSNAAFREFGDLPEAERNRQDEQAAQKEFVNAFLFNKPISANQTVELWESLEPIYTPSDTVAAAGTGYGLNLGATAKLIGRRANFVGVKEQLRICDRMLDLNNQPLNLLEFFDLNYNIMRARQSQGRTVTDIDWWTNSTFKAQFATAMMGYYKEETLEQFRVTAQMDQTAPLGWSFDSWKVKRPAGVRINILSDNFFDDWYDEFDAQGIGSAGNLLLCLDIGNPGGSIYYAQTAANRKTYQTAAIQELAKLDATYRCTLETVSEEQTLTSETGTVVVECPLNSAWIHGMTIDVPTYTGKTANPSYANLY